MENGGTGTLNRERDRQLQQLDTVEGLDRRDQGCRPRSRPAASSDATFPPGIQRPFRCAQPRRLKNCTARSCFSAAPRVRKVPKFLRLPVVGSFFREYSRYSPFLSFRIMTVCLPPSALRAACRAGVADPGRRERLSAALP